MANTDYISPEVANTLPGLLQQRVQRSANAIAYGYHNDEHGWCNLSWQNVADQVAKIQRAIRQEQLKKGDRVAIMLRNCPEWVMFDIAAMACGLVTVPLYTNDRPDNVAYVIKDAGVKILLIQNQRQWRELSNISSVTETLKRVISVDALTDENERSQLVNFTHWSSTDKTASEFNAGDLMSEDLATIVYTSGTTGKPKGVMLSHKNILANAYAALQCGEFYPEDVFLSFLPLSHTLERTGGCYLPMMASSKVCFARSVQQLAEDIQAVRPTAFISVPRIYEMIYARVQSSLQKESKFKQIIFALAQKIGWRRFQYQTKMRGWHWSLLFWPLLDNLVAKKIKQRLGGRLRYAIAGGAALNKSIAQFFISLGIPVYQGYGMTESSPTISVGRQQDNDPFSIGKPLPGIEVKITEQGELCTKSDCVMLGYFNNPQATQEVIDDEGWLHTGDLASINDDGYLYITGRIKDIIVLTSAEKVPPQDMETTICADPLFDQAMIIGEGKPFLSALLVLNEVEWKDLANTLGLDRKKSESLHDSGAHKHIIKHLSKCLREFPGYAQVRRVSLYLEPWSIGNGLLTPTLKTKRPQLLKTFAEDIESMYESLA
ncbi:MAG: long-chain fatty acid--CoA ligase [Gammaproteobacteria bacterium]|nr:long-chain fatty acid--CoA ligase [Gammaproteobacteria bacterium]